MSENADTDDVDENEDTIDNEPTSPYILLQSPLQNAYLHIRLSSPRQWRGEITSQAQKNNMLNTTRQISRTIAVLYDTPFSTKRKIRVVRDG